MFKFPFLYITFYLLDNDGGVLNIVPRINAGNLTTPSEERDTNKGESNDSGDKGVMIFAIVGAVLFVILAVVIIVYKKQLSDKTNTNVDEQQVEPQHNTDATNVGYQKVDTEERVTMNRPTSFMT